jgi:O-antigen/teichoic acid export membrane protein
VGAVAVLALVSPTLGAFFAWLAAMSLLSLTVLALGVHQAMPRPPAPARASWATLQSVWRFAGGMTGVAFLVVLLTQVDKVLLSSMLTLQDFGYYSFAAMVAGTLHLLVVPITTALFPRLVERVAQKDVAGLAHAYHQGAQMVSVVVAPVALLLVFHGEGVLYAWSADPALARTSGSILSVLAFGTLLNCLLNVPYQAQLAHGWTSLALKVNAAAVALLVPALFWVVPRYGALGAAWVWVVLNGGYLLVNVGLMHKSILRQEKWRWYGQDVALPALAATAVLALLHGMAPAARLERLSWVAYLSVVLLVTLVASAFSLREVRARAFVSLRGAIHP